MTTRYMVTYGRPTERGRETVDFKLFFEDREGAVAYAQEITDNGSASWANVLHQNHATAYNWASIREQK